MTSGVILTTVRSRRPWRMISCPAANGIRCVKPSSATVSPSCTCSAIASPSDRCLERVMAIGAEATIRIRFAHGCAHDEHEGEAVSQEAFLVGGVRTPFGRHRRALAGARPDDLAAIVLEAALDRAGVPHDAVDEVIYGAANQAGEDNRNVARMAVLLSGLSDEVPGYTVNRLCASSLQAVASAAQQIRTGEADVVVAGGVESMPRAPVVMAKPARGYGAPPEMADTTLGWRLVNPRMRDVDGGKATISLGETAEEVGRLDRISRAESDPWGLRSQQRTAAATEQRKADLVPVPVKDGALSEDEVPRPSTTSEALAKLNPSFERDGIVTAGTASPLSDGAGAIVVASEKAVERHGLKPRGRVVAT